MQLRIALLIVAVLAFFSAAIGALGWLWSADGLDVLGALAIGLMAWAAAEIAG